MKGQARSRHRKPLAAVVVIVAAIAGYSCGGELQPKRQRVNARSAANSDGSDTATSTASPDAAIVVDGNESSVSSGADDVADDVSDADSRPLGGNGDLTYYGDTKPILDTACAPCHDRSPSNGAPTYLTLDRYDNVGEVEGVQSQLKRIRARVAAKTMPPDAGDLTATDRATLLDWIDAGGKEGTSTAAISFVSPEQDAESATTAYTIEVAFAGASAGATWDVYYSTQAGKQSGGTVIAEGLPISTTETTWDVSAVAAGTYFVYGVLHAADRSYKSSAAGSVAVTHPVEISFSRPAAGGETADASFDVQAAFAGVDASATWSLRYTSSAGETSGGASIASDLPITTTQVSWDTSGLAAGVYYVYARVRNLGTVSKAAAAGAISVAHGGNHAPSVAVTSPNGANAWLAGTTKTISFSAGDADSDTLSATIELSADGGSTWTTLATAVTGSSYDWAIPGGQSQSIAYRIRVTVDDGNGGVTSDSSDANFGIAAAAITFDGSIQALLQSYCAGGGCHESGGGQAGQYTYADYQNGGGSGAFDKRDRIWARVADDSMPPGAGKVSGADKAKLQLWIWNGAPQ